MMILRLILNHTLDRKESGRLFLSLSADETRASSAHLSVTAKPVGSSVFRFSAGVFRNSRPLTYQTLIDLLEWQS